MATHSLQSVARKAPPLLGSSGRAAGPGERGRRAPAFTRAELRETALLYRQAASDLSTLRQDSTARAYAEHVNQLLARAHHIIYSSRRKGFLKIFYFLRDEYPAHRAAADSLCAAVACDHCWAARCWARCSRWRVRSSCATCWGRQMVDTIERHEMWTHSIVGIEPVASSTIMTNNLSVCFVAFAGGIVFGLGTIYSMFFNGLLLGVIGVACQQHGMSLDLWSFVAPHGSLELPSIILAGGGRAAPRARRAVSGALSPARLHRAGRRGSHAAGRRHHSAAGHRRNARRILFAVRVRRSGSNSRWAACCLRCCWCGCFGRCRRRVKSRNELAISL